MTPSTDVHTAATEASSPRPADPTATRPGPPAVTLCMPASPKTASSWGTRDQVIPSTEVHTVAWPRSVSVNQSIPTATRPGPPAVTLLMAVQQRPSSLRPKIASSWGTRDQVIPSGEVHTTALLDAPWPEMTSPTATRPGPPTVTLFITTPKKSDSPPNTDSS